jgi:hypothetical protein
MTPTTYGPTKPPRLATEFIRPIPAAAANPARNSAGIAQKGLRKLYTPAASSDKSATTIAGE